MTKPPHLRASHPQYPRGFPDREDDALLGHWLTPDGMVVIERHPHGYEIHVGPCYDFANCDACAPDRGPSNPHTDDGHHFRLCENRGPILTVAGDHPETVLEYLATFGSEQHVAELAAKQEAERAEEEERRRLEAEESERTAAEEAREIEPSTEERLAALAAEVEALKAKLQPEEG